MYASLSILVEEFDYRSTYTKCFRPLALAFFPVVLGRMKLKTVGLNRVKVSVFFTIAIIVYLQK